MQVFLFDFDGTLVDSMPSYGQAMVGVLDEQGLSYPQDVIRIITPLGLRGAYEYFLTLGLTMGWEDCLERMKTLLAEAYFYHILAKPGVEEFLKARKQAGDSLNVLTASPHLTLDACLKRLGLWELFDNVWSCEDFGTTKTDPAIYRQAAQRLGVGVEQVCFMDDNLLACQTAKQAGMQVMGILDPSSAHDRAAMEEICDGYLDSVADWKKE